MVNFLASLYAAIFFAVVLKIGEKPYLENAIFKDVSFFQMATVFISVFSTGIIAGFLKNKFSTNPSLNKKWNDHHEKYKIYAIVFGLLIFITYLTFVFIEITMFK